MKRIAVTCALILIFISLKLSAQVYEESWYWGFAGIYPRYVSISSSSISDNNNFGFSTSLGYHVAKHSELRIDAKYLSINSFYYVKGVKTINTADILNFDFDILYSPYPCDYLSPHLLLGFGIEAFNSTNPFSVNLDDTFLGYHVLLGIGTDIRLDNRFNLVAEFSYITSSSNKVDGNYSTNENKGIFDSNGDTYFNASFGFKYNFKFDEEKDLCTKEISGIKKLDEPIIVSEIRVDTVIIRVDSSEIEELKLWGTNFEFNKSQLRFESYPILDNVKRILKKYPDMKIEIHGHSDNIGNANYNLQLSYRRAEAVRNYLVYYGIDSSRMTILGLGEDFPIASNLTSQGRARNRRIEFKITK